MGRSAQAFAALPADVAGSCRSGGCIITAGCVVSRYTVSAGPDLARCRRPTRAADGASGHRARRAGPPRNSTANRGRSATTRGAAEISATFEWGTDMIAATLQANAAINQVMPQLPAGTGSPIRRMDPTVFPIIAYSLTSPSVPLTNLRDIALFQLRPLLNGISGSLELVLPADETRNTRSLWTRRASSHMG